KLFRDPNRLTVRTAVSKIAQARVRNIMASTTGVSSRSAGVSVSNGRHIAVILEPDGRVVADLAADVDSDADAVAQLRDFVSRLRSAMGDFATLGVAVPGLVNRGTNRVEFSAELPAHAQADLAPILSEAAEMYCVIENAANAGGFGELRAGAGRGASDLFYATLGSGIGGCIILEGKI